MTLNDVLIYLRGQGHEVKLMAQRGDPEARAFEKAYRDLYEDQLNVQKQNELLVVAEAYIGRNLTLTERIVAHERYGLKIG